MARILKSFPFGVPSVGPATDIQQALKALRRENYITLQKLFNRFVFLEQSMLAHDTPPRLD
jgi:hypothetical protein